MSGKLMNKTVLICDDDEGIIDVATIVLQDKGYKVISLLNGEKILEKIKEVKPDIILLDLWMPALPGDLLTKQLKSIESTKNIPIIIVSAGRDTKKVAAEAGADGFLNKPFDITELEQIVEKYIV